MALPYFVLAVAPGAVKHLPKPGAWMDHFRSFMGFLLAAAAVWLLYVLSSQVSRERLAAIELALLGLALFVSMRHRVGDGGGGIPWRAIAAVGALATIVLGLTFAAQATSPVATRKSHAVKKLIAWDPFDRDEALRLAAEGRLVFVDVTADWCFTCKVNERLVLETKPVARAFEESEVVAMKADWTNRDDEIAEFLAEHGKYGIPFYLLYRPGREAHIFSEILTREAVVSVIEEAADSVRARLK